MKKTISMFLILIMALTTILAYPLNSYALTMYRTVTKYHLDMGALHIWGTGTDKYHATWQDGYAYGGSMPSTVTLTFGEDIQSAKAYVLDSSAFQWSNYPTYSFNGTDFLTGKDTYDENYEKYVSNSITVNKPIVNGKKVTLSYTASLKSREDFDLAEYLKAKDVGMKFVFDMLGGEDIVEQYYPDLHQRLVDGNGNIGEGVFGYMFFVPIVIEYQVIEPFELNLGEFTADLDVPTSAKPGDSFNVVDKSAFYNDSEFACTQLYYSVDGGSEKQVTGWKGTSLGESIQQSFPSECSVNYRIVTWNTYGDSKTASKTINISDDHAIEINPALDLPDYTYEGHKEIAKDQSTFVVDGVDRSATYVYAEGLASNSFKTDSGTVSIHRLDDTKAECTFSQRGTYDITLNIRADGGGRASTDDLIEVRKTPYIEDSLTGFQKQNRKQVLTATVATYPGKPLTDYTITLKDKVTGDLIRLTPDNLQENTATIKTRTVTMTQDLEKGFAYITVEFLTKTPSYFSTGVNPQDFYYQIDVTDSKGDTDMASKTFAVSPDLPPTAAISLDSAFLRNEGTNTASIQAEDVTVAADGDSVARTWYYGATTAPSSFTDVSTMPGYKKLSFGTDKIVGFDRAGVGKFTTILFVKEVWTEPTLEEYVTDSEHLTGQTTAISDVLNVAPIVSLEMLNATHKDVLLLANNDAEYNAALANKITLKQALLADKIDADVVIKKLLGASIDTSLTTKMNLTLPAPLWYVDGKEGGMTDEVAYYSMAADSERVYIEQWAWLTQSPTTPVVVKAYNPSTGATAWSYTTTKNENIDFGQDDVGKYLYLIYSTSGQTVLLDKRTGAVAGTLPIALSSQLWLTDDSFYTFESGTVYRIDQNTLVKTAIDTGASALSRIGNKFEYVTRTATGVVVNTYDPQTGSITKKLLIDTTNGKGASGDYKPLGIGTDGSVVFWKSKGNGTDTFNGVRVYSAAGALTKQVASSITGPRGIYAPKNEAGNIEHVFLYTYNSSGQKNYITGINITAGTVSSTVQMSSGYQWYDGDFTYFETGGISYLYCVGWYINAGTYMQHSGFEAVFNGSSISSSTVGRIGSYDEAFTSSDRFFSAMFGNNSSSTGTQIKITSIPKTAAQEIAEIIAKYSDPDTYVGDSSTTATQVKEATLNQPKKVVKVTAANDGYLNLNAQSLTPGKKYYYEYDLKPLTDGTKTRLTGIGASTGTSTSGQTFAVDTLYVSESHEEDFSDTNIDPFFTVDDPGVLIPDGTSTYDTNFKGYGAYDEDGGMQLSFTVPAGKQAIVTTDFHMSFSNLGYDSLSNNQYRTASEYDSTNVFVDGNTIRDLDTISSNYESNALGAMYYQVLGPGTHTVGCGTGSHTWNYVLIDNLKVDILSTVPKTLNTSFNTEAGNQEGWLSVNGSFETPNKVISYGSQASTTYYGALPSAITDTTSDRKGRVYPSQITYYQTVPDGYIQKGRVYFSGSVGPGDEVGFTPYNCGKYRYEERSSFSGTLGIGEWRSFGALTAGTYSHIADTQDEEYSYARMDTFDIVQYPYNAVTATGNIAFNSSNTEYFFPKVTSNQSTNLSMFIPKGEYLIKNLRLYYIENGQKVYLQNKALENVAELPNWTLSSGLTAANYSELPTEEEDEPIKIYKKGEKVLYNIFYDDYEADPSKAQYWVYQHINWPPDTVHPDVGKILTAPIDRFYQSGKYTVTHWEQDNTQRAGTTGDATPYNKLSNQVSLTFYVDGEGKAPWITYIKTNPSTVKENNSYTIKVGVDDTEKDTLTLETEVYLNGKSIKTDTKTGINTDSNGDYPEQTISGLPNAKVGVYQIICTVSDYSGTGIKSYKFTVVSEGKITGYVNHTEQWNINRQKYNLAKSGTTDSPRGYNVFWSGEKFMLRSEVAGSPTSVTSQILGYSYSTTMHSTGVKNAANETIFAGEIWDKSMINKWGKESPVTLTFRFTAYYSGGITKTHDVNVIVDNRDDYYKLHRYF